MSDDLDDDRPQYVRVADDLRSSIKAGRPPVGQRLPPAKELAATYGIAVMTVNHALRVLRDEGIIVSQQGRGSFVRQSNGGSTQSRSDAGDSHQMTALEARIRALEERVDRLEVHEN